MNKNRKKFFKLVAGAIIIIIALSGLFISLSKEDTLFYYTVNEVFKNQETHRGKKLRVMGMVKTGSVNWNPKEQILRFMITENQSDTMIVLYKGVKPDMFREGQGVVAQGKLNENGEFASDLLLVKHSEEYKTPHDSDYKKGLSQTIQY